MPDEKRVKELYNQMLEHHQELMATDPNGGLKNTALLAAAYVIAALEEKPAE